MTKDLQFKHEDLFSKRGWETITQLPKFRFKKKKVKLKKILNF
jgi:hypothetical protein